MYLRVATHPRQQPPDAHGVVIVNLDGIRIAVPAEQEPAIAFRMIPYRAVQSMGMKQHDLPAAEATGKDARSSKPSASLEKTLSHAQR